MYCEQRGRGRWRGAGGGGGGTAGSDGGARQSAGLLLTVIRAQYTSGMQHGARKQRVAGANARDRGALPLLCFSMP